MKSRIVLGNTEIWNPVKLKLMRGEKVTGGTVFASANPSTYCAMANAGYDFIWTEMQHDSRDWENVAKMWATCPHAKAVPGVRVAYTDEREIQHAMDAGALVVVVPTVRTVEEGTAARDWTYFPPLGKRSQGGGPAFSADFWGTVPGGYRNTINQNVVLIEMIETIDGAAQAREIAAIPGVDAVFASASSTWCMTLRSRRARDCAAPSRGAIGLTSPASKPAARQPPSLAAWLRNLEI